MKKKENKKKNKISFKELYLSKRSIIKGIILLLILIITIYFAYSGIFEFIVKKMGKYGLLGVYINGIIWGYSFASVPATAMFIYFTKLYNPWIVAIIGALGVVTENTLVFILFKKEISEKTKKKVDHFVYTKLKLKGKNWLIILAALIVMVTPIPNEVGIYLLTIARLDERIFMIISFLSSFMGIMIIAGIGSLI
ncbi:MAG: hypothetical protein WC867_08585 [Candidatus Pacearchaeota archaeon]|jgi:hypothetical protein